MGPKNDSPDSNQNEDTPGWDLLNLTWFNVITELNMIVDTTEDPKLRIAASDVLLRYFVSLGQSINTPFVPNKKPEICGEEDE